MKQSGFFSALFDFTFSQMVTPRIARVLYAILLVCIACGVLVGTIGSMVTMSDNFFAGVGLLALTPLAAILYAILARMGVESVMVMFRIAENVEELATAERKKQKP